MQCTAPTVVMTYAITDGYFDVYGGSGQWGNATVNNIDSFAFNSDGTLNNMTISTSNGNWQYSNGAWKQL